MDHARRRRRPGARPSVLALALSAGALVIASVAWRRHLAIGTANALTDASLRARFVGVVGTVAHYVDLAFTGRQSPMSRSWRAPTVAASLAAVALATGVAAGLRALRPRAPAVVDRVSFGLAWLVLLAAPSAAAVPSTGQYANRYLYAPLMGWAIVVAAGLDLGLQHAGRARRWILAAGAGTVLAFALVSAQQAARWRRALDLYAPDVEEAPDDGRVLYNYGVAVAQAQGCGAALPIFQRAAARTGDDGRAWNNVAGCLLLLHRPAEAVAPARRAVAVLPGDLNAALNLGAALALSGDRDGARPVLTRACAARPQAPACALLR
ncbi:MAG: hypothetical protein U0325_13005 [Polyangiales bacterium]